MPDTEADQLYRLVVEGFRGLGAAEPEVIRRSILYGDSKYVGQRFYCGGMKAVWLADRQTVTFYDAEGELLTTVSVDEPPARKAA